MYTASPSALLRPRHPTVGIQGDEIRGPQSLLPKLHRVNPVVMTVDRHKRLESQCFPITIRHCYSSLHQELFRQLFASLNGEATINSHSTDRVDASSNSFTPSSSSLPHEHKRRVWNEARQFIDTLATEPTNGILSSTVWIHFADSGFSKLFLTSLFSSLSHAEDKQQSEIIESITRAVIRCAQIAEQISLRVKSMKFENEEGDLSFTRLPKLSLVDRSPIRCEIHLSTPLAEKDDGTDTIFTPPYYNRMPDTFHEKISSMNSTASDGSSSGRRTHDNDQAALDDTMASSSGGIASRAWEWAKNWQFFAGANASESDSGGSSDVGDEDSDFQSVNSSPEFHTPTRITRVDHGSVSDGWRQSQAAATNFAAVTLGHSLCLSPNIGNDESVTGSSHWDHLHEGVATDLIYYSMKLLCELLSAIADSPMALDWGPYSVDLCTIAFWVVRNHLGRDVNLSNQLCLQAITVTNRLIQQTISMSKSIKEECGLNTMELINFVMSSPFYGTSLSLDTSVVSLAFTVLVYYEDCLEVYLCLERELKSLLRRFDTNHLQICMRVYLFAAQCYGANGVHLKEDFGSDWEVITQFSIECLSKLSKVMLSAIQAIFAIERMMKQQQNVNKRSIFGDLFMYVSELCIRLTRVLSHSHHYADNQTDSDDSLAEPSLKQSAYLRVDVVKAVTSPCEDLLCAMSAIMDHEISLMGEKSDGKSIITRIIEELIINGENTSLSSVSVHAMAAQDTIDSVIALQLFGSLAIRFEIPQLRGLIFESLIKLMHSNPSAQMILALSMQITTIVTHSPSPNILSTLLTSPGDRDGSSNNVQDHAFRYHTLRKVADGILRRIDFHVSSLKHTIRGHITKSSTPIDWNTVFSEVPSSFTSQLTSYGQAYVAVVRNLLLLDHGTSSLSNLRGDRNIMSQLLVSLVVETFSIRQVTSHSIKMVTQAMVPLLEVAVALSECLWLHFSSTERRSVTTDDLVRHLREWICLFAVRARMGDGWRDNQSSNPLHSLCSRLAVVTPTLGRVSTGDELHTKLTSGISSTDSFSALDPLLMMNDGAFKIVSNSITKSSSTELVFVENAISELLLIGEQFLVSGSIELSCQTSSTTSTLLAKSRKLPQEKLVVYIVIFWLECLRATKTLDIRGMILLATQWSIPIGGVENLKSTLYSEVENILLHGGLALIAQQWLTAVDNYILSTNSLSLSSFSHLSLLDPAERPIGDMISSWSLDVKHWPQKRVEALLITGIEQLVDASLDCRELVRLISVTTSQIVVKRSAWRLPRISAVLTHCLLVLSRLDRLTIALAATPYSLSPGDTSVTSPQTHVFTDARDTDGRLHPLFDTISPLIIQPKDVHTLSLASKTVFTVAYFWFSPYFGTSASIVRSVLQLFSQNEKSNSMSGAASSLLSSSLSFSPPVTSAAFLPSYTRASLSLQDREAVCQSSSVQAFITELLAYGEPVRHRLPLSTENPTVETGHCLASEVVSALVTAEKKSIFSSLEPTTYLACVDSLVNVTRIALPHSSILTEGFALLRHFTRKDSHLQMTVLRVLERNDVLSFSQLQALLQISEHETFILLRQKDRREEELLTAVRHLRTLYELLLLTSHAFPATRSDLWTALSTLLSSCRGLFFMAYISHDNDKSGDVVLCMLLSLWQDCIHVFRQFHQAIILRIVLAIQSCVCSNVCYVKNRSTNRLWTRVMPIIFDLLNVFLHEEPVVVSPLIWSICSYLLALETDMLDGCGGSSGANRSLNSGKFNKRKTRHLSSSLQFLVLCGITLQTHQRLSDPFDETSRLERRIFRERLWLAISFLITDNCIPDADTIIEKESSCSSTSTDISIETDRAVGEVNLWTQLFRILAVDVSRSFHLDFSESFCAQHVLDVDINKRSKSKYQAASTASLEAALDASILPCGDLSTLEIVLGRLPSFSSAIDISSITEQRSNASRFYRQRHVLLYDRSLGLSRALIRQRLLAFGLSSLYSSTDSVLKQTRTRKWPGHTSDEVGRGLFAALLDQLASHLQSLQARVLETLPSAYIRGVEVSSLLASSLKNYNSTPPAAIYESILSLWIVSPLLALRFSSSATTWLSPSSATKVSNMMSTLTISATSYLLEASTLSHGCGPQRNHSVVPLSLRRVLQWSTIDTQLCSRWRHHQWFSAYISALMCADLQRDPVLRNMLISEIIPVAPLPMPTLLTYLTRITSILSTTPQSGGPDQAFVLRIWRSIIHSLQFHAVTTPDNVLAALPILVQALRWDVYSLLGEALVALAVHRPLFCHRLEHLLSAELSVPSTSARDKVNHSGFFTTRATTNVTDQQDILSRVALNLLKCLRDSLSAESRQYLSAQNGFWSHVSELPAELFTVNSNGTRLPPQHQTDLIVHWLESLPRHGLCCDPEDSIEIITDTGDDSARVSVGGAEYFLPDASMLLTISLPAGLYLPDAPRQRVVGIYTPSSLPTTVSGATGDGCKVVLRFATIPWDGPDEFLAARHRRYSHMVARNGTSSANSPATTSATFHERDARLAASVVTATRLFSPDRPVDTPIAVWTASRPTNSLGSTSRRTPAPIGDIDGVHLVETPVRRSGPALRRPVPMSATRSVSKRSVGFTLPRGQIQELSAYGAASSLSRFHNDEFGGSQASQPSIMPIGSISVMSLTFYAPLDCRPHVIASQFVATLRNIFITEHLPIDMLSPFSVLHFRAGKMLVPGGVFMTSPSRNLQESHYGASTPSNDDHFKYIARLAGVSLVSYLLGVTTTKVDLSFSTFGNGASDDFLHRFDWSSIFSSSSSVEAFRITTSCISAITPFFGNGDTHSVQFPSGVSNSGNGRVRDSSKKKSVSRRISSLFKSGKHDSKPTTESHPYGKEEFHNEEEDENDPAYKLFQTLVIHGFLAARKCRSSLSVIVSAWEMTNLACFHKHGGGVEQLEACFMTSLDDKAAAAQMRRLLRSAKSGSFLTHLTHSY